MSTEQRNGRLEEALATLLQNQATLVQNQAAFISQIAETNRRLSETDRRLAELEQLNAERFARIEAILLRHEQLLQALPEAIREKIGLKAPGT